MLGVDTVRWVLLSVALAAEPAGPQAEPLTLEVANRPVFTFQVTAEGISPVERLTLARSRLESIPQRELEAEVTVRPLQIGQERAAAIFVGPRFLFHVTPADVAAAGGGSVEALADQTAAALRQALQAEREQRSLPLLLRGLLWSAVATAVAALLLWLLVRARRLARAGIHHATASREGWRRWGVDFAPAIRSLLNGLVFLVFWLVFLSVVEVWLTYVLSQFPLTRPWSDALLGGVLSLLEKIGSGLVHGIPGLATALVILLVGRGVAAFVGGVFRRVEWGTASIPGIHPETAAATRRIAVGLVWLVALAAAYPYLPGSGSDAFKGLSLLVGLMLSLGSTGVVAQVTSGLVLIYSRALFRGDCVQVGAVEGVVTEVTLLSTRILTLNGEEVILPNAVVINGSVKNFGRASAGRGALVYARVSIGYDAPWRRVHELLLTAAKATPGVRADPAPYVLQRALDDFYVSYELVAAVVDPVQRPLVASDLNARIQDAFNAAGVQIMSPHYVLQPREPVLATEAVEGTGSAQRTDRPGPTLAR
jgi:small-conductance mechanosensitive channel